MSEGQLWFALGAAVVGLISAVVVFISERNRKQSTKYSNSADFKKLQEQIRNLERDLDNLKKLQNESSKYGQIPIRRRHKSSATSVTSTADYLSANDADSSDLEFYDLSSEEEDLEVAILNRELELCDKLFEKECSSEEISERLESLLEKNRENSEVLWRYAKMLHLKINSTTDSKLKQQLIDDGISICEEALRLQPNSGVCHKWYAIFIGLQILSITTIKDKLLESKRYRKHIELALRYTPEDPVAHNLLGRYKYEMANLSWWEKSIANTLFGEVPNFNFDEALDNFLLAEKYTTKDWKENRLFIAKCEIGAGRIDSALKWLEKAEASINIENDEIEDELKALLQKYKK